MLISEQQICQWQGGAKINTRQIGQRHHFGAEPGNAAKVL